MLLPRLRMRLMLLPVAVRMVLVVEVVVVEMSGDRLASLSERPAASCSFARKPVSSATSASIVAAGCVHSQKGQHRLPLLTSETTNMTSTAG